MTQRQLNQLWIKLGIPAALADRARPRIQREAKKLTVIGRGTDGRRMLRLAPRTARAWRAMQAAAAADGVTLIPVSAFRSVARQTKIIRRKLAAGQTIDAILRVNAVPGCSEHHTGRALDLGTPGELSLKSSFGRSPAFRWLKKNASRFGFTLSYPPGNAQGIVYEPWHWCWRPVTSRAKSQR